MPGLASLVLWRTEGRLVRATGPLMSGQGLNVPDARDAVPLVRGGRRRQAGAVGTSVGLRALGRDRRLLCFVVLAVVLSWAWWVPVALTGGTASHFPPD